MSDAKRRNRQGGFCRGCGRPAIVMKGVDGRYCSPCGFARQKRRRLNTLPHGRQAPSLGFDDFFRMTIGAYVRPMLENFLGDRPIASLLLERAAEEPYPRYSTPPAGWYL